MARKASRANRNANLVYTLEVFLFDGPVTKEFVKKNPVVCRTIQIKGNQTLEDLHHVIFDAFDREDEHMYEFQVGGKGPMDRKAKRYGLRGPEAGPDEVGNVKCTPFCRLGLSVGDAFGYWFDFGDDWWHQINVRLISRKPGTGKYPRVTRRIGKSPPQYIDWDKAER